MNYAEDVYLLSGFRLTGSQIVALFQKKIIQTYRNWIMLIIQIIIPSAFIIITVLSERTRARFQNLPPLKINLASYEQTVTILETSPTIDPNSWERKY